MINKIANIIVLIAGVLSIVACAGLIYDNGYKAGRIAGASLAQYCESQGGVAFVSDNRTGCLYE